MKMSYREIRVRPVVRYVVTDFECNDEFTAQSSTSLGSIFENVESANRVAKLLAADAMAHGDQHIVYEPARALRIEWLRGPGEPQEAIRWELREVDDSKDRFCRGIGENAVLDRPAAE
jgi:hypothetical protein